MVNHPVTSFNRFIDFIETVFDKDGKHKLDVDYFTNRVNHVVGVSLNKGDYVRLK